MPAGGAPVKSTAGGGLHGRPPAAGLSMLGMLGRGVLWLLGSVVSARRGTLVLGIIAGRIFTPGQFGAVAAALAVVLAFRSLGEFGASRALERYEGDPREIAPAVMTVSVVSGAALAALCFTTSTGLAAAAGAPAAAQLIRVLAFDILIGGLVAAPAAMLRLHPRGIRRSIADQSGNWLGVVLTCWLAVSGHGMLSFGIGLLAGAILRAILIVVFAPTSLRMGLGRGHLGLLAGAALPLAGSGLAMFALLNADQLIVGHLKGAASLGCYALAVSLASWPITLLAEPVLRAAPGSFARLRTSPQLQGSAYLSSAALLASLTLPAGFLLSAMAVPLVHLAYGPQWALAAKALEWLAPLVALRLLCKLTSDYLTEFKGAVSALVFQLVWLAAMIPSVIIWTLADGIAGAAIAQVVIAGARLLPWYLVETRWLSRGRGQVMRIVVPLAAGLTVAFVVIWVRRVVPDDGVDLGLGALAGLDRGRPAGLPDALGAGRGAADRRREKYRVVLRPGGQPGARGGHRVARAPDVVGRVPAHPDPRPRSGPGTGRGDGGGRARQQGPVRGPLEHGQHPGPAGGQLHGRRGAGPDRVRAAGLGPLRHLPAGAVGGAQRQRDGGQPGRGALGR